METLKTAEELFEKYELKAPCFNEEGIQISEDDTDCIFYDDFLKALTEHDNELISEIEKKIKEKTDLQNIELDELDDYKDNQLINDLESEIEALTEIITLIKEKK